MMKNLICFARDVLPLEESDVAIVATFHAPNSITSLPKAYSRF